MPSTRATRLYRVQLRYSISALNNWSPSTSGTRASNGSAGGTTRTILVRVNIYKGSMPPGIGGRPNRFRLRWCQTPHSNLRRLPAFVPTFFVCRGVGSATSPMPFVMTPS